MSVMGFCRLKEGPEEMVGLIKGVSPELYIEIPSEVRNRMEVIVGTKVKCFVVAIMDKSGNTLVQINQERIWEIIGYWHELYIPPEDASTFGLKQGDYISLILKSVDRVTEKNTREEVEI